jgi:hypothetical protein
MAHPDLRGGALLYLYILPVLVYAHVYMHGVLGRPNQGNIDSEEFD